MLKLLPIALAVFISAVGYGVSFPLLSIRVEQTGVDGALIGLNAAMPALGWIVGSAVMPILQLRLGIGIAALALAFLTIAAAAIGGLRFADDYTSMTVLRFFFGGSMGLFYRSVEYWINCLSPNHFRARNLSINGVAMMSGVVVGSILQPSLGSSGWLAFGSVMAFIVVAMLSTTLWPRISAPPTHQISAALAWSYITAMPVAYVAVLAYGLDESVPASLAQIYAIKNGLGVDVAAYTLSAAALGNILIPIPVALLSDRIGRIKPLAASATVAALTALAIPFSLSDTTQFLLLLLVCAGCAGTVYGLALAMIGDRYSGADLVLANAAFGIVYAVGSIVGPLINGAALDTLQSQGLMLLSGVIFIGLLCVLAARWLISAARLA